jgi:hypothetical protein
MIRSCAPFLSFVFFVLVVPVLALGQSLGDIARKEAERREKNKGQGVAAQVIGEDELKQARSARDREAVDEGTDSSRTSEAPVPPVTAGMELSLPERSTKDESEQRRRQEHEWRSRAAQAEARVKAAKQRYEQMQSMHLTLGEYYEDSKGRVISTPEQLQKMTARAKAELEAAEKALEDLRDSARRAGIPPGWLR